MAAGGDRLTGYRTASGEVTLPLPGSTLEALPTDADAVDFSGLGHVVTYTVVRVPSTRFKGMAPYALAVIELNEGARLLALVDGGDAENLTVDARVQYISKDEYGYHFALM